MATVRFSDSLKRDILRNARDVFKKRIEDYLNAHPVNTSGWADRIYNTLVDTSLQQKLAVIPKDWVETSNGIGRIQFDNAERYKDFNLGSTPDGVNVDLKYSKRRPVPINRNHDIEDDIPYSILVSGYNLDWNNPDFKWLRDEYMRLNKPIYDIKAEAREFVDGVEKVIESHSTLAKALKKWEGLWDLLPSEAKERHKRVVERYDSEPVEDSTKDVDFDKLTVKSAAHDYRF